MCVHMYMLVQWLRGGLLMSYMYTVANLAKYCLYHQKFNQENNKMNLKWNLLFRANFA